METNTGSGSLKSTSASTGISEELCVEDLFPKNDEIVFVKKISDAKFPVFLISCTQNNKLCAMKIFPWEQDAPSQFYRKEMKFSQFCHPNIISMYSHQRDQETSSLAPSSKISYIIMEYAKYGDFFDVLISYKIPFNDILTRTYFHQLIEALEVLHSEGAAHLDLKLENILMAEDYKLKLADFDLSYLPGDGKVTTRGTKNFRAPEMFQGTCTNPQAADIYSAGIILFLLKTEGLVPYREHESAKGIELEDLRTISPKKFWARQCEYLEVKPWFFSEDFKNLFMWMTRTKPEERPTIAQIKNSKWYQREIYTQEEIIDYMNGRFDVL